MVGKLHKRKISEYTEAAENDEKQQLINEKSDNGDETTDNKDDQGSCSESENGDAVNEDNKNIDSPANHENSTHSDIMEIGDDDEKLSDVSEEGNVERGKIDKKTKKRKASKKDDGENDETVNGTVSPKKKGRKNPINKGKGKNAGKKGGRGKAPKKNEEVNEEGIEEGNEERNEEENEEGNEEGKGDGDEEYEVKDIVDHKIERGVSYFLIRWKGYTKDDDTWEAEDTLNCPDIIEKYKKKKEQSETKKGSNSVKKGKGNSKNNSIKTKEDPNKEWEVEKIIDYAMEKNGRVFRIRWKGFGPKHDTWEPEKNLSCDDIIQKFMKRMKSQENITFKELREEPKKTKRLVNETSLPTTMNNPLGRKSKRSSTKNRVFYGDMDE